MNAQIQTCIVMTLLRLLNRVARIKPVYGDVIIRIGKAGASLAGSPVPCANDGKRPMPLLRSRQAHGRVTKTRGSEAIAITPLKFVTTKSDRRHSFSD